MQQLLKRITAFIVLIAFLALYGGNTMFHHKHKVGDSFIVHSHPHSSDESSNPGHNHTSQGICLINILNHLVLFSIAALALVMVAESVSTRLLLRESSHVNTQSFSYFYLRGPPANYFL